MWLPWCGQVLTFDVTPANGILAIQESMQVEIMFKPMTIGDHSEDLVISYDTGESMYIVWGWGKTWYLGTGMGKEFQINFKVA